MYFVKHCEAGLTLTVSYFDSHIFLVNDFVRIPPSLHSTNTRLLLTLYTSNVQLPAHAQANPIRDQCVAMEPMLAGQRLKSTSSRLPSILTAERCPFPHSGLHTTYVTFTHGSVK